MALDFGRYLLLENQDRDSPSRSDFLDNFEYENRRGTRRTSPADRDIDGLRNLCSRGRRASQDDRESTEEQTTLPCKKLDKEMYNSSVKASFPCELMTIEVSQSDGCIQKSSPTLHMGRKRNVSFADESGHDLATYCWIPMKEDDYYYDTNDDFEVDFDVPSFPEAVFSASYSPRSGSSPLSSPPSSPSMSSDDDGDYFSAIQWEPTNRPTEKMVELNNNVVCSLCFEQPGALFDQFMKTLEETYVCLENVRVEDITVFCSVKVKNIGFEKSVHGRCSYDGWLSFVDIPASHVPSGCDTPIHDTFSLAVYSPPSSTLSRRGPRAAELAICYTVNNVEYWDNNKGNNYRIVWSTPRD